MSKECDYNLLMSIGTRISARRKELKLTQAELAERCDIIPSHLSDIENGKVNVTICTLSQLAFHLTTSIDYLVYGIKLSHALSTTEQEAITACSSNIGEDYITSLNNWNQFLLSLSTPNAQKVCQSTASLMELIIRDYFKTPR